MEDTSKTTQGSEQEPGAIAKKPEKKKGGKFLFILIIIGVLGAALAAALLTSQGRQMLGLEEPPKPKKEERSLTSFQKSFFVALPDILVNLSAPAGTKQRFLKISLVLELTQEKHIQDIQVVIPRIVDQFQVYLRELRVDDFKGSEAMYQLRDQLLVRVNAESAPIKVRNVLFKNMLVQ
ncbi:MAG: flagellar basal body-associated FliL family protein [Alphaproteobacteria bacterium]